MFFIAYTFKGQVHVFAGRVKIFSHSSCRTSAILKYFLSPDLSIKYAQQAVGGLRLSRTAIPILNELSK